MEQKGNLVFGVVPILPYVNVLNAVKLKSNEAQLSILGGVRFPLQVVLLGVE